MDDDALPIWVKTLAKAPAGILKLIVASADEAAVATLEIAAADMLPRRKARMAQVLSLGSLIFAPNTELPPARI